MPERPKSKYFGVAIDKRNPKAIRWVARGKRGPRKWVFIGTYDDEKKAARAVNTWYRSRKLSIPNPSAENISAEAIVASVDLSAGAEASTVTESTGIADASKKKKENYRGVTRQMRQKKKWIAQIYINGKSKYQGIYNTAKEAALAADLASIALGRPPQNFSLDELNKYGRPKTSTKKISKTGYYGLTRARNSWRARIHVNGQLIRIGSYATPEEAARAVDWWLIDHGLDSKNFPSPYLKDHGRPRKINATAATTDEDDGVARIGAGAGAGATAGTSTSAKASATKKSTKRKRKTTTAQTAGETADDADILDLGAAASAGIVSPPPASGAGAGSSASKALSTTQMLSALSTSTAVSTDADSGILLTATTALSTATRATDGVAETASAAHKLPLPFIIFPATATDANDKDFIGSPLGSIGDLDDMSEGERKTKRSRSK